MLARPCGKKERLPAVLKPAQYVAAVFATAAFGVALALYLVSQARQPTTTAGCKTAMRADYRLTLTLMNGAVGSVPPATCAGISFPTLQRLAREVIAEAVRTPHD